MPATSKKSKKSSKKQNKAWEWSPIDLKEVFVVTKEHKMLLGGELLTEVDLKNLQSEVKALKAFRLWRIFNETLRNKAVEMGFIKAENWEQTMSGKMAIFNLDVLKSITDVLEQAKPLHTPPAPPHVPKHKPEMFGGPRY